MKIMLIVSCLEWLTCLFTYKWWNSKAPTYYFIDLSILFLIQRLNATPTLLRDSNLHSTLVMRGLGTPVDLYDFF